MEKLMERRVLRTVATVVVGFAAVVALSGCAETEGPTPEEIKEDIQFFELDGVAASNGEPVRCALYSVDPDYESWFGFDCDFEGTATFPSEIPQTTTTTLG